MDIGPTNFDWFIWRPILAKITTLEEIRSTYGLNDLLDAHEALDVQAKIRKIEANRKR